MLRDALAPALDIGAGIVHAAGVTVHATIDEPVLRRLSPIEFSAASGAVHYVLAWTAMVLAFWGSSGPGQGLFLVFVGYVTAFSLWAFLRTRALAVYLSARPTRNAPSLALHLFGGIVVLIAGLIFGWALGVYGVAFAAVGAAFVVPALSTRWAVGDDATIARRRPGVVSGSFLAALLVVFTLASFALLLAAFLALSPSDP